VTIQEQGKAGEAVPDPEVLEIAVSMSTVYQARELDLDRVVAVKWLDSGDGERWYVSWFGS